MSLEGGEVGYFYSPAIVFTLALDEALNIKQMDLAALADGYKVDGTVLSVGGEDPEALVDQPSCGKQLSLYTLLSFWSQRALGLSQYSTS